MTKVVPLPETVPAAFAPQAADPKLIASAKKKLAQGWRRNATSLQDARSLAYWLHVAGRDTEALAVAEFVGKTQFAGNFNVWSPVETALALVARLLRARGDHARDVVALVAPHAVPARLQGSLLRDATIARLVAAGDKTGERSARMAQLTELVFIREIGDDTTRDAQITEQLAALKPFVAK